MIIQQSTAMLATTVASYLSAKRQTVAPIAEKIADTTTISQAAKDRLSSEKANESSTNSHSPLRVEGPFFSFEETVKSKGGPLIAVKMTEAQVNELKLREQQEKAREIANSNYAEAHQYKPIGQVLVGGKLFATVSDAGSVEMAHSLPLSEAPLSPTDRLAEIARAVKGEIIYSNLLPTMGGGMGGPGAPESMLPPLTARSMNEIFDQEIRPAMEKKITEWEEQTGKTYPRPKS
ncbi:MAG: hypothetical protein PHG47_07255 [Sulfuricella sp.]|nr:hypothetical protein [Sulfuricella sp.]